MCYRLEKCIRSCFSETMKTIFMFSPPDCVEGIMFSGFRAVPFECSFVCSFGDAEFAGVENAGVENTAP